MRHMVQELPPHYPSNCRRNRFRWRRQCRKCNHKELHRRWLLIKRRSCWGEYSCRQPRTRRDQNRWGRTLASNQRTTRGLICLPHCRFSSLRLGTETAGRSLHRDRLSIRLATLGRYFCKCNRQPPHLMLGPPRFTCLRLATVGCRLHQRNR